MLPPRMVLLVKAALTPANVSAALSRPGAHDKSYHKSRAEPSTLNPNWGGQEFCLPVQDPTASAQLECTLWDESSTQVSLLRGLSWRWSGALFEVWGLGRRAEVSQLRDQRSASNG